MISRITYSPVPLVSATCVTLVCVFVKVRVAWGITAPEVSFTVPLIDAADRCAQLALGKAISTMNAARSPNLTATSALWERPGDSRMIVLLFWLIPDPTQLQSPIPREGSKALGLYLVYTCPVKKKLAWVVHLFC